MKELREQWSWRALLAPLVFGLALAVVVTSCGKADSPASPSGLGNPQGVATEDPPTPTPPEDPPPTPTPTPTSLCWFTGGGQTGDPPQPTHSYGGNINPGCSPVAGQGGNWNHVFHQLGLHLRGTAITVLGCGNVPGIPEGSTSPATDVNYIEFEGTGTLGPIQGNSVPTVNVTFFGRLEDRNEPGEPPAVNFVDRYLLRIYDATTGALLQSVGPLPITKGNLQIHTSSCD